MRREETHEKHTICCCRATASAPRSSPRAEGARCGGQAYGMAHFPTPRAHGRRGHRQVRRPAAPALGCRACVRRRAAGAVGGPKWEGRPGDQRPEKGLLRIRKGMGLYANKRPAKILAGAGGRLPAESPRSSTGRGLHRSCASSRAACTSESASASTTSRAPARRGRRPARVRHDGVPRVRDRAHRAQAFEAARKRRGKVTSVDKANVLETSRMWREIVTASAQAEYPDVE